MQLDGAVVAITGAAGGIGRGLVRAFSAAGSTVTTADLPGRAAHNELDVTDLDATRRWLAAVREQHGRVDVVIANAGIGAGGLVEDLLPEDWTRSIAVNVMGTANTVQAAYPVLLSQQRGAIVLMASLAGLLPTPLLTSYATTKYAIVGLGASLRIEAARHGVGVTTVCPGPVDTALLDVAGRTAGTSARRYLTAAAGPAIAPGRLGAAVVDVVRRNRAFVTPGRATVLSRLQRLAPGATARVVGRNLAVELRAAATQTG
ncbi:MAG: SDR family NAD(P)-dependent oxidoreductase [Acidimicrobiia bacterium]